MNIKEGRVIMIIEFRLLVTSRAERGGYKMGIDDAEKFLQS